MAAGSASARLDGLVQREVLWTCCLHHVIVRGPINVRTHQVLSLPHVPTNQSAGGFTAVRDVSTGKYHGFVDTGCYSADVNPFSHMGGFQITHVVGDSPLGPFVGAQIAAPPTHYNPHAYHFDDGSTTGLYVLYTNGGALRKAARVQHQLEQARMARGAAGICNGMEENHTHHPLAFVMPDGKCTTALCAIYAMIISLMVVGRRSTGASGQSFGWTATQYSQDRPHKQYSYSVSNRVRGGNGGMKTDDTI